MDIYKWTLLWNYAIQKKREKEMKAYEPTHKNVKDLEKKIIT